MAQLTFLNFPKSQKDTEVEVEERLLQKIAAYDETLPKLIVRDKNRKWRLSSGVQKAVRRKEKNLAYMMGAGLLFVDPEYAWRRTTIIALEDCGTAAPEAVEEFLFMSTKKAWRQKHGGDAKLYGMMLKQLTEAPSCRAACDSVVATAFGAEFKAMQLDMAKQDTPSLTKDLIQYAESKQYGPAVLAAIMLRGTEKDENLPTRQGSKNDLIRALSKLGIEERDLYVVRRGLSVGAEGMPLSYALIRYWYAQLPSVTHSDDDFPEWDTMGVYPSYVFDQHNVEGKRAIAYFDAASKTVSPYLRGIGIDDKVERRSLIAELLFRADSDRLVQRIRWGVGQWAEDTSTVACIEYYRPDLAEHTQPLLGGMREEMPLMNYARKKVLKSMGY